VVAGGVDRPGGGRDVPHLVERVGWLAREHDVAIVSLRQEPEPGRWRRMGVEVLNVGRRPRRIRASWMLHRLHKARPFDVLHAFGLVPQGVVVAGMGRTLGVPVVLEAPGGEFADEADLDFGGWRRRPGRIWIRSSLGGRAAVVNSFYARETARLRGIQSVVVPLGIDPNTWPARSPSERHPSTPLRLAWVGSLNPVKQPRLAVDVLSLLGAEDVTLDVAGEDFLSDSVRSRARAVGVVDRIRFHGLLPQPAVSALLTSCHALLVTSRFEAAGRVVLEAASQGIPTVGFAVGYVSDWADDAAAAVDPSAGAAGLARAVTALANDEGRRLALAGRAAARLAEHVMDKIGARWLTLYERLVSGAARHAEDVP
jgi:glycosyltransferase involved in cell wall biosynthesis